MDIIIEELEDSLWVAAVHDRKLEGIEIDPIDEEVRWGSIYYGQVIKIDKAMDAAFIDLDGFNTGILHNADCRFVGKDGKVTKGGADAIGTRLKAGDMVAVQAKDGYLFREDSDDMPMEDKSVRLSMDITLQGRYLIYAPMMRENRLSNRIRDKKMRRTLNKMMDQIETISGCILRAAAANTQTDILVREGHILQSIWDSIQEYFEGSNPQLIMLGPDAFQRAMSDNADRLISRIEVATMERFGDAEEWCEIYAPDLITKIFPIEMKNPYAELALFDHRDILGEIEELFHDYTKLTNGSNIIIQDTAALIAIDVNRGSAKGSNVDINVQAAKEIARQIRIRNIGGIIVVDFLKMKTKKEQGMVIAALEKAMWHDPCTTQIHGMTALGLMEITRKRRTFPLKQYFRREDLEGY